MILKLLRMLFRIRTPAEDFEAGRQYVRDAILKHGKDNTAEMNKIWYYISCSPDFNAYDRGIQKELNEQDIQDPDDPRWEH